MPDIARRSGNRAPRRRALRRSLPLAVLLLLAATPLTAGEAYRLGPEDRIRLKVFEWRASRDEIFSWEALNDDYAIGADGELSLPLAGSIDAAGRTQEELAQLIGAQMATRLGLGRTPAVAVDIVEYRPFYIVGPIAKPGAYPFRPGLTVLKALTLAGGLRERDGEAARLRREAISGGGDVALLAEQREAGLIRAARLEAELAGAETFAAPDSLGNRADDPATARTIGQEQAILSARTDAYRTQMDVLNQLHTQLESEIPTQEALLETVKVQIKTVQDELATVDGVIMSEAMRVRRLGLERALAQLEGERLQTAAALLRARQEANRAQLSIVELRTQRTERASAELRETQAVLDQTEARAATARRLLADTVDSTDDLPVIADASAEDGPVYSIMRQASDGTVTVAADETTPVLPGDAIRVAFRSREDARDDARANTPGSAVRATADY